MNNMHRIVSTLAGGAEKTLCVLNGVLGDTLEEHQSGLATNMALYTADKPIETTARALGRIDPSKTGKICILVHGICGSQKSWRFKGDASTSYGSLLHRDLGFIPLFVRYNSGLHISVNGKRLSKLLEELVRNYPTNVREIMLIGYSMGGLIIRSACHYGQQGKKDWVARVKTVVYLGSPHLGTHLEKLGRLTTAILKLIPNPVTKIIGSLGNVRSAGIKDLRHGYITDDDWQRDNADDLLYRHDHEIPLLETADHYFMCGTLSKKADSMFGRIIGDGLVHPASGTGRGMFSSSAAVFAKGCHKVMPGIPHHRLHRSLCVYKQIKAWCVSSASSRPTRCAAKGR